MKQVLLGRDGPEVGAVSYGHWRLAGTDAADARAKVAAALDAGMTLHDTADVYGAGEAHFGAAEELFGEVLRADPGLRGKLRIATKGGVHLGTPYDNSNTYLMEALDASLARLGVGEIDLYFVHRPDLLTGVEELAATLDAMVESGKVHQVGLSNFTVAHMRALAAHMKAPIAAVQCEFSPVHQAPLFDGTLDYCQEVDATFMAWSPLAGGRLIAGPGHWDDAAVRGAVDTVAGALGTDRAGAAIAFLLAHPARIVPIVGTQTVERIRSLAAAADLTLTRRQWYDIVEAWRGAHMP